MKESRKYTQVIDGEYVIRTYSNGDKTWCLLNTEQLHRLDGPAGEMYNGDKFWYRHGKLHRLDGPAIYLATYCSCFWYYEGVEIGCNSQEEFERLLRLRSLW